MRSNFPETYQYMVAYVLSAHFPSQRDLMTQLSDPARRMRRLQLPRDGRARCSDLL